jgi:hypothetical protein
MIEKSRLLNILERGGTGILGCALMWILSNPSTCYAPTHAPSELGECECRIVTTIEVVVAFWVPGVSNSKTSIATPPSLEAICTSQECYSRQYSNTIKGESNIAATQYITTTKECGWFSMRYGYYDN